MPPRYRERGQLPSIYCDFYWQYCETRPHAYKERITDNNPGPGPCTHIKRNQGLNYVLPGWRQYIDFDIPRGILWNPPVPDLDWGKLPSSTEANIISLIAEIDEILSTLTIKFWRQLSYGAVTWGIVPLISDIKAGLKAIINIGETIDGTQYEATTHTSEKRTIPGASLCCGDADWGDTWFVDKTIEYHAIGKVYYQDLGASALLDRLGFHPDLATLWDLVPFSFVVDYIIPIGNFLESYRRGGWVKAVYFNGWVSAKARIRGHLYRGDTVPNEVPYDYSTYSRYPLSSVLIAPEPDELPSLELPTFEEVFNMAYLGNKKLQRVTPPIHWDWVFPQEDN